MEGSKKISKELQQETKAYRQSLYAANPELEKYAKKKNVMILVLFALTLLDFVWKILVICEQGAYEQITVEFIKLLIFSFVYYIAYLPFMGKYLLWLLVLGNLTALPTYMEVFQNIGLYWAYSPVFVLMYLTELIYIVCLLVVTVWRTLFGQNRRYDEQAKEIEKKCSDYIQERIK